MAKIHVDFIRGKHVESSHQVKVLVTNANGKTLLSTNNDNEFFSHDHQLKYFKLFLLQCQMQSKIID